MMYVSPFKIQVYITTYSDLVCNWKVSNKSGKRTVVSFFEYYTLVLHLTSTIRHRFIGKKISSAFQVKSYGFFSCFLNRFFFLRHKKPLSHEIEIFLIFLIYNRVCPKHIKKNKYLRTLSPSRQLNFKL